MKITISKLIGRRPVTPADVDVARLERTRADSKWREFDEPAVKRKASRAKIMFDRVRRGQS